MVDIIKPDWPAPSHIHAYSTTRNGGYSEAPYDSLNFGEHVGDSLENVATNRGLLMESLSLPNEPLWLEQIHSNQVICADAPPEILQADASFAKTANKVCVVTTADCLPLLLCNKAGTIVAAVHAGWRGLATGIIEQTAKILLRHDPELMAWMGPAIGPEHYEVGDEVRQAFISHDPQAEQAFKSSPNNRWLADMYLLARQRLNSLGIQDIYGGGFCTFSDSKRFFSYRRDGVTGRMATLIWIAPY